MRSPNFRASSQFLFALAAMSLSLNLFSSGVMAQDPEQMPPSKTEAALLDDDAPSRGSANVSPEVARKAAAIARQTMSPFCPGRTLSDCPSEYATEWRKDIRLMVARGMSANEIQAVLEQRAGSNLSGNPNRNASYAVPIGLALGAGLLLFYVFARLRRNADTSKKGASQIAEKERSDSSTMGDATDSAAPSTREGSADRVAETARITSSVPPQVDDARLEAELDATEDDRT